MHLIIIVISKFNFLKCYLKLILYILSFEIDVNILESSMSVLPTVCGVQKTVSLYYSVYHETALFLCSFFFCQIFNLTFTNTSPTGQEF